MALLDALERHEGFTEVKRLLADYIFEHAEDVAHMNIAELAAAAYTSKASIVRLCRKLGLDGYRTFRIELSSDLERHRLVRGDVDIDHPFLAGDDRRSVFAGGGERYEGRHRRHIRAPAPGRDRAGDVALFVNCSGDLLDRPFIRETLASLDRCGATTVLVSSGSAPAGIDLALRLPAGEARRAKIGTYYSQASIRFALNCLYAAVYALDYKGSARIVEGPAPASGNE